MVLLRVDTVNDTINNSPNVKGRLPQCSAANWALETAAVLLLIKIHYCGLYIWNLLLPFSSALIPCSCSSWIKCFCYCSNCSVKSWQGAYSQFLDTCGKEENMKNPSSFQNRCDFCKNSSSDTAGIQWFIWEMQVFVSKCTHVMHH